MTSLLSMTRRRRQNLRSGRASPTASRKRASRVGLLHAFDQDEVGINEIAAPGYTLVSAELSYTTEVRAPDGTASQVTIGVRGENLADD